MDGCEILHQLIDGKHPIYPIIYRVSTCFNHPFCGAGFLPFTVLLREGHEMGPRLPRGIFWSRGGRG